MGIINKGILGGFSGKVGNVIGSSWKGIDYMRSVPNQVSNPNTDAQQTQRTKFTLVVEFLTKIKPVINAGFKTYKKHQTNYNSATSYNLKKAVSGKTPDIEIDFEAAMVTRGTLMPAYGSSAKSDVPNQVKFTWADNSGIGNAEPDDQALLVLYNKERKRALCHTEGGPVREDGSFVMNVPQSYGGENVEAYIGFVSADGSEAADSVYLGSVKIAEQTDTGG